MTNEIRDNQSSLHSASRLTSVRESGLLDSAPERAFDRLTELAAIAIKVPISLVTLVASDRQFFKSQVGLPEPWASDRETPLNFSMCQFSLTNPVLVVDDVRTVPECSELDGLEALKIRSYLGVCITADDGEHLGAFCVADHVPRKWTEDQIAIVTGLARSVESELRLKKALLAAESALRLAEKANREKTEFVSLLNHELRTPLASVLGFARLLGSARYSAEQKAEWRNRIVHNGEHLLNIINNTLALVKFEAGGLELEPQLVALRALVEEAVGMFSFLCEENGFKVQIEFSPPKTFPELILTDPMRLRQILANLIGNAAKYSDFVRLTVGVAVSEPRASASSAAARMLQIAIEDHGPGISAERVAHLFEPFQATDAASPPKRARTSSTGLGLTIARKLARQMGGDLTFDESFKKGARFVLQLPLNLDLPESATGLDATQASGPLQGARLLLFEPNNDLREVLGLVLEGAGAEVCALREVRQVRELLEVEPFEAVLVDLASGSHTADETTLTEDKTLLWLIRQNEPEMPVLGLLSNLNKETREGHRSLGYFDILPLPLEPDSLILALRNAIQARSANLSH